MCIRDRFLGASMTSDLNIGVRHVLPVYPFAAVLAGACAWTIAKSSKVAMYAVAAALLFQMVSSLRTYPNYIPYANEAFGGPDVYKRQLDGCALHAADAGHDHPLLSRVVSDAAD